MINRHGNDTGLVTAEIEHELGDVQQFVGEFSADLHLVFAECSVDAGPRGCRPISNGVTAVLVEEIDRCHHVALRFGHLLAIGIENPPGKCGALPGARIVRKVRSNRGGEQPRANDVVALWAHVHGEHMGEQVVTVHPVRCNLRCK